MKYAPEKQMDRKDKLIFVLGVAVFILAILASHSLPVEISGVTMGTKPW